MQVRKWMTRNVVTVSPRDSLARAQRLLEEHRIDQLPVVVEGRLVGLLTARDIHDALESAREVAGRNPRALDAGEFVVEAAMTPHVLTVEPDDSIAYAALLLRRERIGCLPVVEGARLVGILTRSDLLKAFMEVLGECQAVKSSGKPELYRGAAGA
ncbi:MAG: CBS domain-containing protein [Candidatus Binatia bacterium]|nr:CBS domain-containing protein [Candidatus Binatia bacterium]